MQKNAKKAQKMRVFLSTNRRFGQLFPSRSRDPNLLNTQRNGELSRLFATQSDGLDTRTTAQRGIIIFHFGMTESKEFLKLKTVTKLKTENSNDMYFFSLKFAVSVLIYHHCDFLFVQEKYISNNYFCSKSYISNVFCL